MILFILSIFIIIILLIIFILTACNNMGGGKKNNIAIGGGKKKKKKKKKKAKKKKGKKGKGSSGSSAPSSSGPSVPSGTEDTTYVDQVIDVYYNDTTYEQFVQIINDWSSPLLKDFIKNKENIRKFVNNNSNETYITDKLKQCRQKTDLDPDSDSDPDPDPPPPNYEWINIDDEQLKTIINGLFDENNSIPHYDYFMAMINYYIRKFRIEALYSKKINLEKGQFNRVLKPIKDSRDAADREKKKRIDDLINKLKKLSDEIKINILASFIKKTEINIYNKFLARVTLSKSLYIYVDDDNCSDLFNSINSITNNISVEELIEFESDLKPEINKIFSEDLFDYAKKLSESAPEPATKLATTSVPVPAPASVPTPAPTTATKLATTVDTTPVPTSDTTSDTTVDTTVDTVATKLAKTVDTKSAKTVDTTATTVATTSATTNDKKYNIGDNVKYKLPNVFNNNEWFAGKIHKVNDNKYDIKPHNYFDIDHDISFDNIQPDIGRGLNKNTKVYFHKDDEDDDDDDDEGDDDDDDDDDDDEEDNEGDNKGDNKATKAAVVQNPKNNSVQPVIQAISVNKATKPVVIQVTSVKKKDSSSDEDSAKKKDSSSDEDSSSDDSSDDQSKSAKFIGRIIGSNNYKKNSINSISGGYRFNKLMVKNNSSFSSTKKNKCKIQ